MSNQNPIIICTLLSSHLLDIQQVTLRFYCKQLFQVSLYGLFGTVLAFCAMNQVHLSLRNKGLSCIPSALDYVCPG